MIYQNDIANLKMDIEEKVGQRIIVKGSLGRNRPFEKSYNRRKNLDIEIRGRRKRKNRN